MDKFDRAIESLQNIVEYWTCRPSEVEAAKLAITALKQQQEREQGCKYCKDEAVMISGTDHSGFYLAGEALTYSMQTEPDDIFEDNTFIHFCPMCGRRLEESENEH